MTWSAYLQNTKSLHPRKLLVEAVELVYDKDYALDLGCGACNDAHFLLGAGFSVTAVDSNPESANYAAGLHFVKSSFEDFLYEERKYDLINAQFALPFNAPTTFDEVFEKITASLKPGGIFVGQFFGPEDEWAERDNMSFHSSSDIGNLLKPFEVLVLREENSDGKLASGGSKHWHIFHVIARKK